MKTTLIDLHRIPCAEPTKQNTKPKRDFTKNTHNKRENNLGRRHYLCMGWKHISDHDLERYYLGMIKTEKELASLEEHILACSRCAKRAEEAQDYVDAIRAGLIKRDHDRE